MYYLILTAAVSMFSIMFLFNQSYQKIRGSSAKSAFTFLWGSNIAGTIALFAINKFQFEFAFFTLAIAAVAALNNLLYNVCSIFAFGKVNLSLFSVFAMSGGMVLPFVAGILFYNEELTLSKILCIILIIIALIINIGKGEKKQGLIYCLGVFIFNGMSGVISKFYSSADVAKASEASYSMMMAMISVVFAGLILLFIRPLQFKTTPKAAAISMGAGLISCTANFLLLISLRELPASVQYPFVTGGTMVISTILCYFTKQKPTKKEILSIVIAFIGILILVMF